MKWEDTMMTDRELMAILEQHGYTSEKMAIVRKTQAELSFKAGRHIGRNQGVTVGRLEVVEWLDTTRVGRNGKLILIQIQEEKWQAKLKEWGIDEEVSDNIC